MKDTSNVQAVRNGNVCSIHHKKSNQQNPSNIRNNTACNCHISINNPTAPDNRERRYGDENNGQSPTCWNSNVLPSTSIQIDSNLTSLSSSACNRSTHNNAPNELPLIDGVKRLYVGGGPQMPVSRTNIEEGKDNIDDDSEPPPCYSELFEKPLSPSSFNIK